jgi:hypothetical protein
LVSASSENVVTAGYRLNVNKNIQEYDNNVFGYENTGLTWMGAGTASNFQVRATIVSGSVSSGTIGTWENLGTTRTWTRQRIAVGVVVCTLTIEIRDVATATVRDTAQIVLIAERDLLE